MIITIPARLSSSRLPNKLLLAETGHPLIWYAVQSAKKSKLANKILVLTEDIAIYDLVVGWCDEKVTAIATPPASSGTERIARYVSDCCLYEDKEVIVNMQADEPELHGAYIDALVADSRGPSDVATLAKPVSEPVSAPSDVKVVVDHAGYAMYFSRSHIPYSGSWLHHIGVYAYTAGFLKNLRKMPNGTLGSEHLEQLQWLQAGYKVRVMVSTGIKSYGIDTRAEYERFKQRKIDES